MNKKEKLYVKKSELKKECFINKLFDRYFAFSEAVNNFFPRVRDSFVVFFASSVFVTSI